MANVDSAFTPDSSFSLDSLKVGMVEPGVGAVQVSLRGPEEQSGVGRGEGGLPSSGRGLTPNMQAGRSCRGCLYFSRTLQDSGRDPLCVGIASAEAVPAVVFQKHRQMREQEASDSSKADEASKPQSSNSQHEQQRRQQQKASNFERQQKILEDFRYACIGYSVFPTAPPQTTLSSQSTPPPPSSASKSPPSSSRLPPPSSTSFLSSAAASASTTVVMKPDSEASFIGEERSSSGVGLATLLRADGSSSSGGTYSASAGSATSAGRSTENPSGGGLVEETSHCKKTTSPPPLLPICVGIEILAGTKSPEKREAAQQPHPQPLPQHAHGHTVPVGLQQDQPVVMPIQPESEPEASQPGRELPSWATRNSKPPQKGPPLGGPGITLEEFTRRYARSSRLITKKCFSNFERLKGAVHSTVQDIFRGDK